VIFGNGVPVKGGDRLAGTLGAGGRTVDQDSLRIYDISMGVHRSDAALIEQINAALAREEPPIGAIVTAYHVSLETLLSPGGA
jgi:hypothetical protein